MDEYLKKETAIILNLALEEDFVHSDCTSLSCIDERAVGVGQIIAKEELIVAGLFLVESLFPGCGIKAMVQEGEKCQSKTVLCEIEGPLREILARERIALNFLQHLSGIATITGKFVDQVKGLNCEILDTRKTLPGMRHLQKYAVRMGGGVNHRMHLAHQIMIKDNHLSHLNKERKDSILWAVKEARSRFPGKVIEVEIEDLESLPFALEAKPDRILLDNMDLSSLQKAVQMNKGTLYLEASGGVNLSTVRSFASSGVNGVSVGMLTHSVKAVDIHLELYKNFNENERRKICQQKN